MQVAKLAGGDAKRMLIFAREHGAEKTVLRKSGTEPFERRNIGRADAVTRELKARINIASNADHHGEGLSVFATVDCSGDPIENVPTNQQSFPNFSLRERIGYVTPADARSARIELLSDANGAMNDISWDNIMVDGPPVPVEYGTWGAIKALYK